MRTRRLLSFCLLFLCCLSWVRAQFPPDGDQCITNNAGNTFLTPDDSIPAQPSSFTVGDAAYNNSAFNVMGGQADLPLFNVAEFHCVAAGLGYTRWFRGNNANPNANAQMGRIFTNAAFGGLSLQQCQQGGSFWFRNWRNQASNVNSANTGNGVLDGNGLRLIDDFAFNLNGYTNNARRGHVGIGHAGSMDNQGANSTPLPWSRLHLVHANNLASGDPSVGGYVTPVAWNRLLGYRPWMRNGMMITGNLDQMYVGHKYRHTGENPQGNETPDASDAVVQWADTLVSTQARDNLRYIFTTTPDLVNNPTTGARSREGLELMRLHPADSSGSIVPHIGLGDFFKAGVLGDPQPLPTARLDT